MYDHPFTLQWYLDRCLEGDSTPWIIIPTLAVILIVFLQFLKNKSNADKPFPFFLKQSFSRLPSFTFLFSTLVALLISTAIYLLIGYEVAGCSDETFWRVIRPAHKLHASLKDAYSKPNSPIPKSEAELKKLGPGHYSKISAYAKTDYIYNQNNNSYTWFIRPSQHYVVIFDSEKDYQLYRLSAYINHWPKTASIYNYPPKHPGPWDQLPR